jgi:hypothetical protein
VKRRTSTAIAFALWIVAMVCIVGAAIHGNRQRQPFLDTWEHHANIPASAPEE